MCMRYFDVWNKHQYWIYIIHVEFFLFVVSFSFWSLKTWQFFFFFGHILGLGFPWKMFCYGVWWVYMWIKKSSNLIFCLVIDIYDFFYTWSMKKMKKYKFKSQSANIFGIINQVENVTSTCIFSQTLHFK
jgi:hypothetical protein